MQVDDQNLIIDRGIALHKMIRLFTASLGGEAYLNFIGNEFGHPEWVDFPREGNNWSYKYTRRQWSLADNKDLKYKYLLEFDKSMIALLNEFQILPSYQAKQLNMDETNKVIVFERANLIFAFNFHPSHSIPDYHFPSIGKGKYKIVLNSDEIIYGGHGRVDSTITHHTLPDDKLSVYLPNRTVIVLKKMS
jgi:1,4-alpha-glucan branching enzyme